MPSPMFSTIDAMPMVPAPAEMTVRSRQRTKISQAESGRILSRAYGGQYYEVSLIYNPMKRSDAAPLIAFLQSREGRNSIFKVEISGFAATVGSNVANFANVDDDTKLHMIAETDPAVILSPEPRFTGATLSTDQVFMRASLARDVQEISLARTGLIQPRIDLIERL